MNPKLAILSRVQGMAVARRRRLCAPASRIVIGAASPTPSCTGRPAIAPAAGGTHGVAISQRRFRIAQAPGPVKLEQRPRPIMTAIARRRRHARLAMAAPRGTSSRPLNGIRQTGDHPAGCAGTAMPSTPRWVREMAWPCPMKAMPSCGDLCRRPRRLHTAVRAAPNPLPERPRPDRRPEPIHAPRRISGRCATDRSRHRARSHPPNRSGSGVFCYWKAGKQSSGAGMSFPLRIGPQSHARARAGRRDAIGAFNFPRGLLHGPPGR